jgi:hypothetical protein
MFPRFIIRPLFAVLLIAAVHGRAEENIWPFYLKQQQSGDRGKSEQFLGPIFFAKGTAAGEVQGFRPFFMVEKEGDKQSGTFLYPVFSWYNEPAYHDSSFLLLINRRHYDDGSQGQSAHFDLWPFYSSHETGDPATSYHALFPIVGTVKQRFRKDRMSWVLFPLYFDTEEKGMEITTMPWPFFAYIRGAGHHGFEFWPVYGQRWRTGDYDKRFFLWPFFYKFDRDLSTEQPTYSIGALPFYTRDSGPGSLNVTFAWPLFGFTRQTRPVRYNEQRYLWPFLVQGQGEERNINRWAPLYTHSVIKGYDKTWVLWPLFRHGTWEDTGIAEERNQFFYFLYFSQTQRSLTNPAAAPANKTHVWPLFSYWDNGAGRRQVQFISPLEVFFPNNDTMRQLYNPLFAVYTYDRQGAAASRHCLLWGALTYRRSATDREFHLGPLLSVHTAEASKRVAFVGGVFGWQRRPGEAHSRFFLFDFKRDSTTKVPAATPT